MLHAVQTHDSAAKSMEKYNNAGQAQSDLRPRLNLQQTMDHTPQNAPNLLPGPFCLPALHGPDTNMRLGADFGHMKAQAGTDIGVCVCDRERQGQGSGQGPGSLGCQEPRQHTTWQYTPCC